MSQQGSAGNVIAALCSFFIVGLGQIIQGRILPALLFFVFTYAFYGMAATGILFFFWPFGAILHLWAIIDAAKFRSAP